MIVSHRRSTSVLVLQSWKAWSSWSDTNMISSILHAHELPRRLEYLALDCNRQHNVSNSIRLSIRTRSLSGDFSARLLQTGDNAEFQNSAIRQDYINQATLDLAIDGNIDSAILNSHSSLKSIRCLLVGIHQLLMPEHAAAPLHASGPDWRPRWP